MDKALAGIPGWDGLQEQIRAAVAAADPVQLLIAEHEWLRSIVTSTDAAFRDGAHLDAARFRTEQHAVRRFIEKHILKEELEFFPFVEAVLERQGEKARTQEMRNEHDAIRMRYDSLQRALDRGTVRQSRSFRHLWRALVVHFDNEERYLFEEARPALSRQESADLAMRLAQYQMPAEQEKVGGKQMAENRTSTYLRTHRLKASVLSFLLGTEADELRERASESKTGRAAKTLVKEGPLSVTIVALRSGCELQSHHVAGPVTVQSLRGCLRLTTDGGDVDVPDGALVALDAGVAHNAKAIDDCTILLTVAAN